MGIGAPPSAGSGPGTTPPPPLRRRIRALLERAALTKCGTLEALSAPLVLFGSRARGEGKPHSDLDLVVVVRGALTPELERQVWLRIRQLLLPVLPVDLDLVIVAAAAAEELGGSRWHVLGHAHREGVVLYAA